MSYYNYGSLVIQDLKTLETVTLSSTGITYKNSTTTIIPWSTISTGGGGGSVTDPLNVSSGNFSSIDSNNTTLNIGTVKATTINVGKSNTSLNVISGIINASNLMIYSGTLASSTCYLDTIVPSNLSTQIALGQNNADQVYIGDGTRNKSIWIGRGTNFNNDICIGNSSSTVTVGGTLNLTSGSFNASYFTLSSKTFGGLSNCCLLDTSVKGTLTTQFSIGQSNAEEVYIGNGGQNKKVVIGNIANTANQITIGNTSSTMVMNASSLTIGNNTAINGDLIAGGNINLSRYKGIAFNNAIGSNTLTSYIVEDGEFHICTDNYMYFKIGCTNVGGVNYGTTVMTIVSSGVSVTGTFTATGSITAGGNITTNGYVFPKGDVIFNNDGSGLRWGGVGGGVSRIVDDGTLRICTDDWIEFKTGSSSTALGDTKMRVDTNGATVYGDMWISGALTVGSGANNSTITLSNAGSYIKTDQYDGFTGAPFYSPTTIYRKRFYLKNVNILQLECYINSFNSGIYGHLYSKFGFETNSTISDFAEMFEWEDGNPENENRVGYTVVVNEQGFIRKATDDNPNDIIGVVSASASFIGSAAGMDYNKKYLKDDFEQFILDASGNQILNPDYDETIEYLPRNRRKEWSIIGLYGKIIVRNGCPINPRWRLIGTRQTAKIYLT